ncbi:MAG: transcriptional regulator [Robiginitomaculum sp.]|nr:MAG: transcriptional regulator [Robiginitomaculum sp.]
MDNRQLKYFCAVYENRNLSHAAQRCNIAQSAISTHISNLESELGVALFVRQARGMEPTIAGTRLYEHAKAILRSVEAAAQDVRQMSDLGVGEIDFGLSHTVIDAIGLNLILRIKESFPRADVVIHEGLSSELFRQISGGDLDFVLCYNAPKSADLHATFVLQEELCCIGRAEFFEDDTGPLSFEEILKLPQILLRRGAASRSIITHGRYLRRLRENASLEVNSVLVVQKALLAGVGVAICPIVTVRDLVESKELVARHIIGMPLTRELSLIRQAGRLPTALMESLSKITMEVIAEEVAAGAWPIIRE